MEEQTYERYKELQDIPDHLLTDAERYELEDLSYYYEDENRTPLGSYGLNWEDRLNSR